MAVIGYPLSPQSLSISLGNVSKISGDALHTTCCVQSGNSGGPVVRWPTGELLGIVVCNVICPVNGQTRPRLNLAVPATVLSGPLKDFVKTRGMKRKLKMLNYGRKRAMICRLKVQS